MVTSETKAKVLKLWAEGWLYKYVAQMCGLTIGQVVGIINRRNKPPSLRRRGQRGKDIPVSQCHEIARDYHQHPEWTFATLAAHHETCESTVLRIVRAYAPEDYAARRRKRLISVAL